MFRSYDGDYPSAPMCAACDDWGCPECCPTEPLTDDDLDEMFRAIEAHEGWTK